MSLDDNEQWKAILRVLRICRLTIILNFKGLRLLIDSRRLEIISHTLAEAAPVLASFGLLFFLFLYIFAIIGMHSFAFLDLGSAPGLEREMSYHINFQDFTNSFVTLLRCSTGEAWNSIMFETSWQSNILYKCNPEETYESIIEDGRDPQDW